MSETLTTPWLSIVPDEPEPAPDPFAVDPTLRLHLVEQLLQEGDLLGAIGQLRAARVDIGRRKYPTYGVGLPDDYFEGARLFDAELALARMAMKAAE